MCVLGKVSSHRCRWAWKHTFASSARASTYTHCVIWDAAWCQSLCSCLIFKTFLLFISTNILRVLTAYVILLLRSDRLSWMAPLYPIFCTEAMEILQLLVIAVYCVSVFCTVLQGPSSEDTFCYRFVSYVEHVIITFCKFATLNCVQISAFLSSIYLSLFVYVITSW